MQSFTNVKSLTRIGWMPHPVSLVLFALALMGSFSTRLDAQQFAPVAPLSFTKVFAGANPLPQTIAVTSAGTAFNFSVTSSTTTGGTWLTVSTVNNCGLGLCGTPHTVTAIANPSVVLAVGSYSGQIVVTSQSGTVSMTIPVTLTVAPATSAFFDNLPGQLSFSILPGRATSTSQDIQIRNGGAGALSWTLSKSTADGGNWITVSAPNGTAPSLLTVGVSVASLPGGGLVAGTFVGNLLFQAAGSSITVPISVVVGNGTLSQVNGIEFTKVFGGADPLPQTIAVPSNGATLNFSVGSSTATGGNWLSVSTVNNCGLGLCVAPNTVTAIVNASPTLAVGSYTGQIVVRTQSGATSITVPVTLTVAPADSAFFDNLPGQMSFSLKTSGTILTSQNIEIRNGGPGALNWALTASTSDGGNWLSFTLPSGTAPSIVKVGVSVASLPNGGLIAGTFVGELVFRAAGSSVTVPVSVVVGDSIFSQVNAINFTKPFAGANPLPQILTIGSTSAAFNFSVDSATATGGNWLTVSTLNNCGLGLCTTPNTITAAVTASATLASGTYTGQIVVTSQGGALSMTVPVTLTVVPVGVAPFFDNVQGQMSFALKTGGSGNPPAQSVLLRNGGPGILSWDLTPSTADGGNWLTASALNGTAPSAVSVTVVRQNLPGSGLIAGTFVGELLFRSAGSSVTVSVTAVVGDNILSQINAISFTKPLNGANPLPQILAVATNGTNLNYGVSSSTATGGNWLTVSTVNNCGAGLCTTPNTIVAAVTASPTLAAGTYTGQIVITAQAGTKRTVPVTLTVVAPGGPFFDNVQGQMSFSFPTGSGLPPTQNVQIRNGGAGTLGWTLAAITSDNGNWLTVSAASGTAPSSVSVGINIANLPNLGLIAGTFTGQLLFQSATSSVTIPVSVVVGAPVFVQLSALSFSKSFGTTNPLPQTLSVASTANVFNFGVDSATATGGNWLSVTTVNNCGAGLCATPNTITATVIAPATMPAGTYTGQIVATSQSGTMAMTVPVILSVIGGTATVVSVTPSAGQQGQTLAGVTIVGQNTNFVQGVTVADFGTGISVNSLTVNSATSATANITVQSGATLGARAVTLTTGTEVASQPNGFTVMVVSVCGVSVDQPTINVSAAPTVVVFNVIAAASCTWTLQSNVPWLNILLNSNGTNTANITLSGNRALALDIRRNASSQPQQGTLAINGTVVTVNQTGSPDATNLRYIYVCFNNFLAREPGDAGVNFFLPLLNSGQLTKTQMAYNFFGAPEFNAIERFVIGLYYGILGRDPDFYGWDFHRRDLHLGIVAQDTLVTQFLATPEYAAKYGNPTNDAFVTLLFQNALGRNPSVADVAAWSVLLGNGTLTRTQVAQAFLNSPEFQTGAQARQTVFLLHATMLSRDPGTAGYAAWLGYLNSPGSTLMAAVNAFVVSPEFQAKLGPN